MKKNSKKTKEKISNKILRYTGFSSSLSGELNFSLTSSGKYRTVLINGIKKIKKCTLNNIIFSLGKEEISFSGEDLICATYSSGSIEISGIINEIQFIVGD